MSLRTSGERPYRMPTVSNRTTGSVVAVFWAAEEALGVAAFLDMGSESETSNGRAQASDPAA